jgi:hypothetical protein
MNSPDKNNYIQYVNEFNKVQTKPVSFVDDGENTRFVVQGIKENFFILAVFQNNIQVFGIGFDDIENNDMLSFLNSNIVDLDCIPNNAFLNAEQVVTMSYNNDYVKEQKNPPKELENPLNQMHPDELYLYKLCKKGYPNKTFTIVPFSFGWDLDRNIYNPLNNKLFYCKVVGSSEFTVARVNNWGLCNDIPVATPFYWQPDSEQMLMFNQLLSSTGNNFYGISMVTPAETRLSVVGFVAVFQEPVFEFVPPAAPEK